MLSRFGSESWGRYVLSFVALLVCVVSLYGLLAPNEGHSDTVWSSVELMGYAWSDNIGWISMNCNTGGSTGNDICGSSNYKVAIEYSADGKYPIKGYGWSDNIGWVKFGGLSDFPAGSNGNAIIDSETGIVTGWARACAGTDGGTEPGDCTVMTDHPDGWDGWISLHCLNESCASSNYGLEAAYGTFNPRYVWGSDVIGWVDFSKVKWTKPCTPSLSCTADLAGIDSLDQWCKVITTPCDPDRICSANPPPAHCVAKVPVGDLVLDPARVRRGGTVTISWSSATASSCAVVGANGDSWTGTSGSQTSKTINSQTLYALSCFDADGGGPFLIDEEIVTLIPGFKEI